jgi:hypothetical protein
MRFKIDDLLITVVPREFDWDIFATGPCDAGTEIPPGPPPDPPGPDQVWLSRIDAASLRMLLQVALIELGGPMRADEMRPRTMEELDILEKKLTTALEEIRALRDRYGEAGIAS